MGSEIQDLVTRYDTLESANKDLMEFQTQCEARNEALRVEFQNYKKERTIENMAFTNRLATMQNDFEEAQKARQELEHLADVATQEDSEHSLHFGQILMSVENLFLRSRQSGRTFSMMPPLKMGRSNRLMRRRNRKARIHSGRSSRLLR